MQPIVGSDLPFSPSTIDYFNESTCKGGILYLAQGRPDELDKSTCLKAHITSPPAAKTKKKNIGNAMYMFCD